jgi:hypothetical protein
MNFRHISQKIEIAAWNFLIPLMKDSPRLASLIHSGCGWVEQSRTSAFWMPLVVWASTGLSLGLILGMMAGMLK